MYNIDFSRAEVSGNGLACLAKFINHLFKFHKNFKKIDFKFYNTFFKKEFLLKYEDNSYLVLFDSSKFELKKNILPNCYYVNVGNPHVICFFSNFKLKKNFSITEFLESLYKKTFNTLGFQANVHLVFNRKEKFYIYSYERGVGFTKSCGSGSIATFYLLNNLNIINNDLTLKSPGGNIKLCKYNNFYCLISYPKVINKVCL